MVRRSLLALIAFGLAACDFPTEPPKWDQTWEVPGERITVSVAKLLPDSVGLNADSSAFEVNAPGASVQFSLNDMCPACSILDGTTVPKPGFGDTLTTSSALPADMVSATLTGGSLSATLAHNLSFDPLRPSADTANPRGYLVIRVTSNGNVVASDSISGDDQAFPAGSSISPNLAIQPVEVADSLVIEVVIFSPAGDPASIDTSDTLGVSLATSTLEVGEVTVNASSITLDSISTTMQFGGLDSTDTAIDHILSGALLFDITNPFDITGNLDLEFQGPFPLIQRTLAVSQGTYSDSLSFTGDELRQILSSDEVDVVASGTVGSAGGTVTVTPTQELVLENRFRLNVLIGNLEDQ